MLKNRLIALICSIMILPTAFLSVCAAPESGESVYSAPQTTEAGSDNTLPVLTDSENSRYVPVLGADAIDQEEICTFDAVYEGETYSFLLRVSKTSETEIIINLYNSEGKQPVPGDPMCVQAKQSKPIKEESDSFKVTFKKESEGVWKLIIDERLMLSDITSFDNINWTYDPQTEVTTETVTDPSITENNVQNEIISEDNSDSEKDMRQESDLLPILIGVGVAVIVIVSIIVAVVIINNKKSSKRGGRKAEPIPVYSHSVMHSEAAPKKQNAAPAKKRRAATMKTEENTVEIPKDIPISRPAAQVKYVEGLDRIPIREPDIIRTVFVVKISDQSATPTAPAVKNNNNSLADTIKAIYIGQKSADELKVSTVPLFVSNVYDLSIDPNGMPKFAVSTERTAVDYMLVENDKLYLNFERFYSKNFKVYSDVVGIDKCFDIISDYGQSKPRGQHIVDVEPAIVKPSNSEYVVIKKGVIKVEER